MTDLERLPLGAFEAQDDEPVLGLPSGLNRGFPLCRRLTRAARLGSCSWDLAEKADTAMHEDEDDEDRIDAAEQLARLDPRAAADAFRTIACDESVDDGLRMEAAERLPRLDRRAAAEAFLAIARDESVHDGLRSSAVEQLARLYPPATV